MIYFYLAMTSLLFIGVLITIYPLISKKKYALAAVTSILISLVTLSLYYYWGAGFKVIATYQQQQQIAKMRQQLAQFKSVDDIIEKLKQTLKQRPDSAQGWYLLGRLYYTHQKYHQALAALQKANQLKPNDPQTLLQLALANNAVEQENKQRVKEHDLWRAPKHQSPSKLSASITKQ